MAIISVIRDLSVINMKNLIYLVYTKKELSIFMYKWRISKFPKSFYDISVSWKDTYNYDTRNKKIILSQIVR